MRMIETVVPAMTLLATTLLAVLPWGLPFDTYPFARHLMPMLPYMVVHYWTARQPSAMPATLVFATGLLIDVMTRGPLGFWSLLYLFGCAIARLTRTLAGGGMLVRWIGYAVVSAVLAMATWALASGYYLRTIDPLPMLIAAGVTALAYPVVALLLASVQPNPKANANPSLARGN